MEEDFFAVDFFTVDFFFDDEAFDDLDFAEELFDFAPIDDLLGTANVPVMPGKRTDDPFRFNRFDPDFTYRNKRVTGLTVAQLEAVAVRIARRGRP